MPRGAHLFLKELIPTTADSVCVGNFNTLYLKEQHFGALFELKKLFSSNSFAISGIMRIFAAVKHTTLMIVKDKNY